MRHMFFISNFNFLLAFETHFVYFSLFCTSHSFYFLLLGLQFGLSYSNKDSNPNNDIDNDRRRSFSRQSKEKPDQRQQRPQSNKQNAKSGEGQEQTVFEADKTYRRNKREAKVGNDNRRSAREDWMTKDKNEMRATSEIVIDW